MVLIFRDIVGYRLPLLEVQEGKRMNASCDLIQVIVIPEA